MLRGTRSPNLHAGRCFVSRSIYPRPPCLVVHSWASCWNPTHMLGTPSGSERSRSPGRVGAARHSQGCRCCLGKPGTLRWVLDKSFSVIMMIPPSSPAILTPQMIHTKQKYLFWLQRKNVPFVSLEVPARWRDNNVTQHTQGCRGSAGQF